MSVSIRMSEKELELVKKYAEINGSTVSEVIRSAIMEKIEDEFDIYIFDKAYEEYKLNPKTYTLKEVSKILDIK